MDDRPLSIPLIILFHDLLDEFGDTHVHGTAVHAGVVLAVQAAVSYTHLVQPGDIAGTVNGEPMKCTSGGVVRGIRPSGTPVHLGMKSGDVDPRCKPEYCTTASDKALAVGGGALEAILHCSSAF